MAFDTLSFGIGAVVGGITGVMALAGLTVPPHGPPPPPEPFPDISPRVKMSLLRFFAFLGEHWNKDAAEDLTSGEGLPLDPIEAYTAGVNDFRCFAQDQLRSRLLRIGVLKPSNK